MPACGSKPSHNEKSLRKQRLSNQLMTCQAGADAGLAGLERVANAQADVA